MIEFPLNTPDRYHKLFPKGEPWWQLRACPPGVSQGIRAVSQTATLWTLLTGREQVWLGALQSLVRSVIRLGTVPTVPGYFQFPTGE